MNQMKKYLYISIFSLMFSCKETRQPTTQINQAEPDSTPSTSEVKKPAIEAITDSTFNFPIYIISCRII